MLFSDDQIRKLVGFIDDRIHNRKDKPTVREACKLLGVSFDEFKEGMAELEKNAIACIFDPKTSRAIGRYDPEKVTPKSRVNNMLYSFEYSK